MLKFSLSQELWKIIYKLSSADAATSTGIWRRSQHSSLWRLQLAQSHKRYFQRDYRNLQRCPELDILPLGPFLPPKHLCISKTQSWLKVFFSFQLAPKPALSFWKGKRERKHLTGYFSKNLPWKKACNIKQGRSIPCKMLITHNKDLSTLHLKGKTNAKIL